MKKIFFSALALMALIGANAQTSVRTDLSNESETETNQIELNLTKDQNVPNYLENAVELEGWKANWFIGLQGGISDFVGSPMGCNDAFGRMKPLFRGYIGKWFSPSVGSRVVFEGFKFNDAYNNSNRYQAYHLDIMWNVLARPYRTLDKQKWSLSPYIGAGLIHTDKHYHHPFSFNYGVVAGYKVNDRLSLSAEISGSTTSSALDNYHGKHGWADNFFGVSIGATYTIGKAGWKKILDPAPFVAERDKAAVRYKELSKEISGLSDFSNVVKSKASDSYKKNDYSGLNSLMARINGKSFGLSNPFANNDWLEEEAIFESNDLSAKDLENFLNSGYITVDSLAFNNGTKGNDALAKYLAAMKNSDGCIGAPVFFFFKKGTDVLVDKSQLVNLDRIADIANKWGLKIRVIGSADSATGNSDINSGLGKKRAAYIAKMLTQKGCPSNIIEAKSLGGIDRYSPDEANRVAIVELHF